MSDHPAEGVYCKLFVGTEIKVPLLNGGETRYINFDNAASIFRRLGQGTWLGKWILKMHSYYCLVIKEILICKE